MCIPSDETVNGDMEELDLFVHEGENGGSGNDWESGNDEESCNDWESGNDDEESGNDDEENCNDDEESGEGVTGTT